MTQEMQEKIARETEEMLAKRAHIRDTFPDITFPTVSFEPLWWGKRGRSPVPDKQVVVDSFTNPDEPIVFSVVSDRYGLRYHEEVLYGILEAIHELPEYGQAETKVTLLNGGGKMRADIIFPEVEYEIRKGDFINPRISGFNSYDLSWKLRGHFGAFQVICSNGATIGKRWAMFAKRHIESLNVSALVDSIKKGMLTFSEETGVWKAWAEKKLNEDDYAVLWNALPFSEKEQEKIEETPNIGTQLLLPDALGKNTLTLWDFSSSMTQYVTHEITSDIRRADVEPQVSRTLDQFHRGYKLPNLRARRQPTPEEGEGDNGNNN